MNSQPDSFHQHAVLAKTQEDIHYAHAAMAEEHARIVALLAILKDIRDPFRFVQPIEELHTLLINHFAHEQFPGGLYESMGAFGSRWHEDLRGLIRDHCLILSEARGVLERARNSTLETQDALRAEVIALVDHLSEHEQKEHHLAECLKADGENESD